MKYRYALGLAALSTLASAGPCDIYSSGGTPCVAAHGVTRALYNSYSGSLYQITRASDGATTDIAPVSAGGVANAANVDSFCKGTTCLISIIYDQSGNANHLTRAPKGGFSGPQSDGSDNLAAPIGAPVTLNGQKAYGVFISPGTGYRIDNTKGVATGNQPEGIYAVMDGTHYNDNCCFDYGNAETSNTDTGNGHMEAIYFGNCTVWGKGAGAGPWIMADLENGLYAGSSTAANNGDPSIAYRFLTSVVKGNSNNNWAIRGGNAQSGSLSTYFNGQRPTPNYNPMSKEGSIILGIGGDNSNGAQGTFYEGVMTSGYPSDATENSVQANIVAAKYATTSLNTAALRVGNSVSLQATTPGYTGDYLSHSGRNVTISPVSSSSSSTAKGQASFYVRTGLGNSGCYSFESKDTSGSFIRHYGFQLYLDANDGSKQFGEDATFCSQTGFTSAGNSFNSWSYPAKWIRHQNMIGYVGADGGPLPQDSTYSFTNDATFHVANSWA